MENELKRKGMSRKRKHLVIAVVVIARALVIIFWGWDTTGKNFLEVTPILNDAAAY